MRIDWLLILLEPLEIIYIYTKERDLARAGQ